MALFRRKAVTSSNDSPFADLQRRTAASDNRTQRLIAGEAIRWVLPFAHLDESVISAAMYWRLAKEARTALASVDADQARKTVEALELAVRLDEELDEPEGSGFFTHGGLIQMLYGSRLLVTSDSRATAGHVVSRLFDTMGYLDDETGAT